jgi:translation initiation factor eIF-2B subunit delta
MLNTFKIAILDYKPSPVTESTTSSSTSSTSPSPNKKKTQNKKPKDIRYSIEHDLLKPAFNYFSNTCRTHSVTMGNAFRFLKQFVLKLDRDLSLQEIQSLCCEAIDEYIFQRIVISGTLICEHAPKKIVDGDVILTYARSEVIQVLLLKTHENFQKENKSFRVILVDSRPLLEGRKTLDVLTKAGIECTYIFLNSLSYVMKEVTKVFMGAAALMSDGSILSRVGTASVALMARSNNIPVLFCCESYKISSRVQLESITGNELGNPDDLISTYCAIDKNRTGSSSGKDEGVLKDWRSMKSLSLLNLLYDLTPSEFVSGIITEMGILPPTSVAVLLREMMPQDGFKGDVLV